MGQLTPPASSGCVSSFFRSFFCAFFLAHSPSLQLLSSSTARKTSEKGSVFPVRDKLTVRYGVLFLCVSLYRPRSEQLSASKVLFCVLFFGVTLCCFLFATSFAYGRTPPVTQGGENNLKFVRICTNSVGYMFATWVLCRWGCNGVDRLVLQKLDGLCPGVVLRVHEKVR